MISEEDSMNDAPWHSHAGCFDVGRQLLNEEGSNLPLLFSLRERNPAPGTNQTNECTPAAMQRQFFNTAQPPSGIYLFSDKF